MLLEGELRARDGKVGRQARRPGHAPFAVGRGRRGEVDDDGALKGVGRRLRGGEDGGGVVVAEEVVHAGVDGGVGGGVCQEGEDGLEGREGVVVVVVVVVCGGGGGGGGGRIVTVGVVVGFGVDDVAAESLSLMMLLMLLLVRRRLSVPRPSSHGSSF